MKKTLAMILAVLMCLSVMVSCGAKEDTAQTTTAASDVGNPVNQETTTTASETESPYDDAGYLKDDLNPELDYNGEKFNLPEFVDKNTGFISHKSKNGRELKAMELPGLWNGAMSDWNTMFVEVPLVTFNPVKTVNDLLRDVHQ